MGGRGGLDAGAGDVRGEGEERRRIILGRIGVSLARNVSTAISVAMIMLAIVLILGLGVLAQRQVDTMKG